VRIVRGIFFFYAGRLQVFLFLVTFVGKALIFPIAAYGYFKCSLSMFETVVKMKFTCLVCSVAVQGSMSRSRHMVTSQRVYGCFRKWVDTRRNVSMEWETPPLLDGYVTIPSLRIRVDSDLEIINRKMA